MAKKVLAGFLVGGAAAFGAWQALSSEKKQQLKQAVADKTHDALDYATDYAINALDLADAMVADLKDQASDKVADKFNDLQATLKDKTATVKETTNDVVSRFKDDDFDEQTAVIREELKAAKDQESQDDIVIDQTNDDQTPAE